MTARRQVLGKGGGRYCLRDLYGKMRILSWAAPSNRRCCAMWVSGLDAKHDTEGRRVWKYISRRKPHAFLWMGDNVYGNTLPFSTVDEPLSHRQYLQLLTTNFNHAKLCICSYCIPSVAFAYAFTQRTTCNSQLQAILETFCGSCRRGRNQFLPRASSQHTEASLLIKSTR